MKWSRKMDGNSESFVDNKAFSSLVSISSCSLSHILYLVIFWYWAWSKKHPLSTFIMFSGGIISSMCGCLCQASNLKFRSHQWATSPQVTVQNECQVSMPNLWITWIVFVGPFSFRNVQGMDMPFKDKVLH